MILQALTQYYNVLHATGEIVPPGWCKPKISYSLSLEENGTLVQVNFEKTPATVGKKIVFRPSEDMCLPAAVIRRSNQVSNFLWDNSSYLLGIDNKDNPALTAKCFSAAVALHHQLLDGVDSPTARAILAFFDSWQPAEAEKHPALMDIYKDIISGANLVFYVNGQYAQDDPALQAAWDRYYGGESDTPKQQCLVTGELDEIAAVHPSIKGVRDAQSSGAALVSFNAPAFCSYGHEQNYNAPVGKRAAFAYTTALNHLTADHEHTQFIGDTTVMYWAETAESQYADTFNHTINGEIDEILSDTLAQLANGDPCDEAGLDSNCMFYILGLAPSASRLSVRFFLKNTFGNLIKNVNKHYENLRINHDADDASIVYLPLWQLLNETVHNPKKQKPSPVMAGAVARAIWSDEPYPASLLNGIMLRIRADLDVNWRRAAILKAYYLRNTNDDCPKEVLTVSLNEASTNIPYTLGRLFSVYEAAQKVTNPGIKATIKNKYFNSASTMPAVIFPILGKLYQKHLDKLKPEQRIFFDNQVIKLKSILGETYPMRLNLPQQGSFDLGYYHQTQKRFTSTKKEDK